MRRTAMKILLALLVTMGMGHAVQGQSLQETGHALLETWQDSVVTVQLVIEMKMSMGQGMDSKEEIKSETTATFVDPSGLAVVPLSDVDPMSALKKLLSGGSGMMSNMNWESQLKDLTLRLSDGTELPAEVVMRDTDLDVAFVKPRDPLETPVKALDFSSEAEPELLEELICLDCLGKAANWENGLSVIRIAAKVDKPRLLFLPAQLTHVGCPVFNQEGTVVGLALIRNMGSEAGGGFMQMIGSMGRGNMGMLPVVLPAADIMQIAEQALKAAAESAEETAEETEASEGQ